MTISLNGELRTAAVGLTLRGLLDELGLGDRRVAVAINREVVPRTRHAEWALANGDQVEIVHAVQGG